MSEQDRVYWWSRGRGDKFLGVFDPPGWASPDVQAVYTAAFNSFQEAQAVIE